jgi:hypothetical protein
MKAARVGGSIANHWEKEKFTPPTFASMPPSIEYELSPFGISPFGMRPLGISPFGINPFGMSPLGISPFGMSPLGMRPFGMSPLGISPFGMSPLGINPFGMTPAPAGPAARARDTATPTAPSHVRRFMRRSPEILPRKSELNVYQNVQQRLRVLLALTFAGMKTCAKAAHD